MNIKELFKNDRYAAMSGVELLEARAGYARAKMPVEDKHFNAGNIVQGGALFTLADVTMGAAANAYGYQTVSIETTIRFFKSTNSGHLFAEAKVVNYHPKVSTYDVRITNDANDLVALFTATTYTKNIPLPVTA